MAGAKNSALKLMAATILAQGTSTIRDIPHIRDVYFMRLLLQRLGAETEVKESTPTGDILTIDVPETLSHEADYELVRKLRASISILGRSVSNAILE